MPADVKGVFDPATHTVSYLVVDPATRTAALVDPVLDFDPKRARVSSASADALLAEIEARGLRLAWILETHLHADHLSAADLIRSRTGAKVVIGADIRRVQKTFGPMFDAEDVVPDGRAFDRLVAEGDVLPLGQLEIRVMHTPGHTPACVTYLVEGDAFVGDTLFMPDYGTARADFPGGDAATLYRSIRRILDLPADTVIHVGHDYLPRGRAHFAWTTTVAQERSGNIHVHDGVEEADFVAMRRERDAGLEAPALILPSLQVNIRAGAMPRADASGKVFLKLPVNAI